MNGRIIFVKNNFSNHTVIVISDYIINEKINLTKSERNELFKLVKELVKNYER